MDLKTRDEKALCRDTRSPRRFTAVRWALMHFQYCETQQRTGCSICLLLMLQHDHLPVKNIVPIFCTYLTSFLDIALFYLNGPPVIYIHRHTWKHNQMLIVTAYRVENMGDGSLIMINFNWITVVKAQVITKHFTCHSYMPL